MTTNGLRLLNITIAVRPLDNLIYIVETNVVPGVRAHLHCYERSQRDEHRKMKLLQILTLTLTLTVTLTVVCNQRKALR